MSDIRTHDNSLENETAQVYPLGFPPVVCFPRLNDYVFHSEKMLGASLALTVGLAGFLM